MNSVEAAVKSVRLRPKAMPSKDVSAGRVQRLRERHHSMARMIAAGLPDDEVMKAHGCSPRIFEMLVEQTPAFIQLIAEYRTKAGRLQKTLDTYLDHLERNMITAEMEMHERLIEDPDSLSVSELHKISRDAADRLGFSKHTVNLNVKGDLADMLEAARRRSGKLKDVTPSSAQLPSTTLPSLIEAVALPAPAEAVPRAGTSPVREPLVAKGTIRRRV